MDSMKAVVFRGPNRLAIEERPKPVPGAGQAVIEITMTTICGTDVNIVRGEYPVRPGLVLGHEPVGVIEALGEGLDELPRRPAGGRRRGHAVRAVLCLPQRQPLAVPRPGRRLAVRQHDRRRLGGVPARARRARQPRPDPRGAHRRGRDPGARRALGRHRRRGERQRPRRRQRRDLRPGSHRHLRDARGEAARRRADHRRRSRARAARDGAQVRRQRPDRPHHAGRRRAHPPPDRRPRRRRRHRGARPAGDVRERVALGPPRRHRSRASASTPASWSPRASRSWPGWATRRS